jgi:hypothetical protein
MESEASIMSATWVRRVLGVRELLAQEVLEGGLLVKLAAERLPELLAHDLAGGLDRADQLVRLAQHGSHGNSLGEVAKTAVPDLGRRRGKRFGDGPTRERFFRHLQGRGQKREGMQRGRGLRLPFG